MAIVMTAAKLAEKLLDIAKNRKTLYVMGCFGAPLKTSNYQRYVSAYTYNQSTARLAYIKAALDKSPPVFGFDCVNLIKAVLWGWSGNASHNYGGATYTLNGVPDISADTLITKCTGVSADFSNLSVGEALWCSGHCGVYIGDGLAVECTPSWENKVQITAVANIGAKSGYNARKWTKHGKMPWVSYTSTAATSTNTSASSGTASFAKGDKVALKAAPLYGSSTTPTVAGTKTGTFYIYSGVEANGRLAITTSAANCGKSPAGKYTTGWVKKSDLTKA